MISQKEGADVGLNRLTKRSQIGMKMTNAKGSKLDNTSFGRPWVAIVAAWDVRLLLIWLYVNPEQPCVRHPTILAKTEHGEPTVNREPDENLASGQSSPKLVDPDIVEGHPGGPSSGRERAWFDSIPETGSFHLLVTLDGVP